MPINGMLTDEEIANQRLITDDSYTDGLREKIIPLWPTLYTYQQNSLRILCDEQRTLTGQSIAQTASNAMLEYLTSVKGKEVSEAYTKAAKAVTKQVAEAVEKERIDIGVTLEHWMSEESSPYRRIAQAEHAIARLKTGQALKQE